MINFKPLEAAVIRLRRALHLEMSDPYYTANTSLSDEMAVDLFKETAIPVVTRDGSKWFRGSKVCEHYAKSQEDLVAEEYERMTKYLRDKYGEED